MIKMKKKFNNIKKIYRQNEAPERGQEKKEREWKENELFKNNILSKSSRAIFYYFIYITLNILLNFCNSQIVERKVFGGKDSVCGNWRKLFLVVREDNCETIGVVKNLKFSVLK